MFVIYGASSSAMTAAFTAADGGEDVTIIEPSHRRWYMWGSGLTQTDRESTFKNSGAHIRWGALLEASLRFSKIARPDLTTPSQNILLVTTATVHTAFESMMADFAVRKVGKGTIKIVMNAPLEAVTQDPQTNAIISITCGGVVYPGLNFHDATDGGFLVLMAKCRVKFGRESALSTGDVTSGVRPGTKRNVRAANLTTGRRLKYVGPRSSKKVGDADGKLMAWNQRIIVTNHANRIRWGSLNVPDYDPANYDTDFAVAMAEGLFDIPGSIGAAPADPVGTIPEYDMNNGGLVPVGSNWINQWLRWYLGTPWDRIEQLGIYTAHKAGLFKDIETNPRWLTIPRKIVKDENGNVISDKQIVEETAKWGLVPGVFVEAAWQGDVDVAVGEVRANGSSIYLCTRAGRTGPASSGGPTGKGTAILDGTGVAGAVWRFLRYYVAGMSPHMYEREGMRIVGEADMQYDDVTAPERNVDEPVTAYGYPHADAHWVNRSAGADGFIYDEGGSGLAGGQEIVAAIMKWGCLKAAYRDCPNLTVSRVTSGTKQGWLVSRLEMCYMKFGDVCGRAAAKSAQRTAAEGKNVYTGDLSYTTDLLPLLVTAGAPLTVPGVAQ